MKTRARVFGHVLVLSICKRRAQAGPGCSCLRVVFFPHGTQTSVARLRWHPGWCSGRIPSADLYRREIRAFGALQAGRPVRHVASSTLPALRVFVAVSSRGEKTAVRFCSACLSARESQPGSAEGGCHTLFGVCTNVVKALADRDWDGRDRSRLFTHPLGQARALAVALQGGGMGRVSRERRSGNVIGACPSLYQHFVLDVPCDIRKAEVAALEAVG